MDFALAEAVSILLISALFLRGENLSSASKIQVEMPRIINDSFRKNINPKATVIKVKNIIFHITSNLIVNF